jgi:hypothetical protein
MMSRRFVMTFAVVAVSGSLATASVQKDALFPHTKQWGPATVEYSHEGLKVVANYNYSQTNHDTPWLIIDLAASSRQRFTLRPQHVTFVTPDGGIVALANRRTVVGSDWLDTRSHIAVAVRHDLRGYFTGESEDLIPFFMTRALRLQPYDEAYVDSDHVTQGPLYFRAPEGRWPAGTYRLAIDNERTKAALPVTLK